MKIIKEEIKKREDIENSICAECAGELREDDEEKTITYSKLIKGDLKFESKIEWVEHNKVYISKCKCGEHHFHLMQIAGNAYLQCGKCGNLINIALNYDDKAKK